MSDDVFTDMLEDDYDEDKKLAAIQVREGREIAMQLLAFGGWTGAQLDRIEYLATMDDNDPIGFQWLEEMREARAREEALKSRLP